MATYVAEHPAAGTAGLNRRRDDRSVPLLLVSGLSLFAVAMNGYHPYAEDGGLYLAGVKRLLDPQLYPYSSNFVLEPTRLSLFAPLVAGITRLVCVAHLSAAQALPAVLLALHLATIWLTLFAAWQVAIRCWNTRPAQAGAVTLLACWLGLPIAGTALVFMDPYLTARSISTPCMVLALVGVLDLTDSDGAGHGTGRQRTSVLWLASILTGAAVHPLMAAYALAASLLLFTLRTPQIRLRGTLALCMTGLCLAWVLSRAGSPEPPEYIRIALTRSYWFLTEWQWYEIAGLVAPLAILALFATASRPTSDDGLTNSLIEGSGAERDGSKARATRQALALTAIAAGLTASVAALLFVRASAASHLLARMQPLRIFQVVYLVLILFLGATLGERLLSRRPWRWALALAVLGTPMLATARAAYPDSPHIEAPWLEVHNPWVQVFLWVSANTPKDALFALDPDYINAPGEDSQCFRAIAERSALADYSKDGGEASIAPALTATWTRDQAAQSVLRLPSATDSQRLAALQPLHVGWLVLDADAGTGFECPYRNETLKVCRLP